MSKKSTNKSKQSRDTESVSSVLRNQPKEIIQSLPITTNYGAIEIIRTPDNEVRMVVTIDRGHCNQEIIEYMARMHNIEINFLMAELIRDAVGSALPELEDAPEDFITKGSNRITHQPMQVSVSYVEISNCLRISLEKIEKAILRTLETLTPNIRAEIILHGICLSGAYAKLRGLDVRMAANTHIPFHVTK